MSLRPSLFPKSIRFKISVWYTSLLALTLTVLGFAVYMNTAWRLEADLENLLQVRAEGIADSIDTYWTIERMGAAADGTPLEAGSRAYGPDFARLAGRWVVERTRDPVLLNIIVQIFDGSGGLITSSAGGIRTLSGGTDAIPAALEGVSRYGEISAELASGTPVTLRALTLPVVENNRVAYIVQVMSPVTPVAEALRHLRLVLVFLIPLALIVSGFTGSLLAGMTMRPIARIVDTARMISADSLQLRLTAPQSRDEIRKLADTFNDMLDRLERSFLSQRQFLEDLAHELKTPLAAMKGEIEVTSKRVRSPGEYVSALSSNLEEVNRIIRIVDDLLVLARLEHALSAPDLKTVDLAAVAGSAARDLQGLADAKGLELRVSASGPVLVKGNEDALKRLAVNMVDNAIKFTPAPGRIAVSVAAGPEGAVMMFEDTGVGILEEELPGIFDRFSRGSRSRDSAGHGLGLSIVKSIVENHGGRIEVRSAVGRGTTFTIVLPLLPPSNSGTQTEQA
jgi:heavy metal sensor kinase